MSRIQIEAYRLYDKVPNKKTPYELRQSFGKCEHFQGKVYLSNNNRNIKCKDERKSSLTVSNKKSHITSFFSISIDFPEYFYGDIKDTGQILLFKKWDDFLEVFVLTLKKEHIHNIIDLWISKDKDLLGAMKKMREASATTLTSSIIK